MFYLIGQLHEALPHKTFCFNFQFSRGEINGTQHFVYTFFSTKIVLALKVT